MRDTIFTTATRKVCNYSPMNHIILGSQIASGVSLGNTAAFRKPVEMKRKLSPLLALLVFWHSLFCARVGSRTATKTGWADE